MPLFLSCCSSYILRVLWHTISAQLLVSLGVKARIFGEQCVCVCGCVWGGGYDFRSQGLAHERFNDLDFRPWPSTHRQHSNQLSYQRSLHSRAPGVVFPGSWNILTHNLTKPVAQAMCVLWFWKSSNTTRYTACLVLLRLEGAWILCTCLL